VILIQLLLVIVFTDTAPAYEQLAINHFFESLVFQRYPDLKSVELATKTDTSIHFGIVYNCTQWDEKTKKEIFSQSTSEPKELKIPESSIAIKKIRDRSGRLKIYVSSRKKVGDSYVVQIIAYRKLRFVDHFFYQFDNNGRLISSCEQSEII
jgi:predicted transcriptional regulator